MKVIIGGGRVDEYACQYMGGRVDKRCFTGVRDYVRVDRGKGNINVFKPEGANRRLD